MNSENLTVDFQLPEMPAPAVEALRALANVLAFADDVPIVVSNTELAETLARLAQEIEDNYVLMDTEGSVPTVAQGVALARFLRGEFSRGSAHGHAHVSRSGLGLPADYLHVYFPVGGYEGGISREGKMST